MIEWSIKLQKKQTRKKETGENKLFYFHIDAK